jgi:hypothetical protein
LTSPNGHLAPPTLIPRLQARQTLLVERLRLAGAPAPQVDALAAALDGVMTAIGAAERGVHGREWAVALRAAQNVEPLLGDVIAGARAAPRARPLHADPAQISESLWVWLITQAELYCKLHLIHLGLAMRDPDDSDDDDDTEMFDFTGHVGEELVRQIGLAERVAGRRWQGDRYLLYRTLHTNYNRLGAYSAARSWVEETDALNYRKRCARMRGLNYYFWNPGGHTRHPQGWQPHSPFDRFAVLGRLLLDRFYWLTAGFGYRPLRAVVLNSAVVLGFAFLYWRLNLLCVFYTNGGTLPAQQCQPVGYLQSLYFSALAFFLAAMGEILPRPLLGQALLVLESIWGFLNVSVVIAVILNRQNGNG